jgi:small subunit ribosomal protein S9
MADRKYHYATGKRKTSIARVRLYPNGKGDVIINGKTAKEFFSIDLHMGTILEPLALVEQTGNFDVEVMVSGGGITGQADAIRHGIAKGLIAVDPEFRKTLKPGGFLTRDARKVERKKPGKRKARRSPQWAKR